MSGQTYLCEVCRLLIEPTLTGFWQWMSRGDVAAWRDLKGNTRSNSPSPHNHKPRGEK